MKRIYIAGPYGGGGVEENVANAIKAGSRLIKAGHAPFIPHLYHYVHIKYPEDSQTWLRIDIEWLISSWFKALIRLPGESDGADVEVAIADSLGIPVYHSVDEFLEAERTEE